MKTKSFLLLLMAMLVIACGQSVDGDQNSNPSPTYKVGSDLTEDLGSATVTSDDSIKGLYDLSYSLYLEFFAELDDAIDYVYNDFGDGEMFMSFTFVDDGMDVTVEVRSDSSFAVRRSGRIYEISIDTEENFVYWARTLTQPDSSDWSREEDKVKLSSFYDLQHALILPMQTLHDAKVASIKEVHKKNVVRQDKLTNMANSLRK